MGKFKSIIWGIILVAVGVKMIFGGVDSKKHKNSPENPHTIFINANCLFGGIDIK